MALRWMAAGIEVAERGFRKVKGYKEIPILIEALRREVLSEADAKVG